MFSCVTDPSLSLPERAKQFATAWHGSINHLRSFSGLPYITHPTACVEILRTVCSDEVMIAAMWLHDLIEDTPCTYIDIEAEFGAELADLVVELTNVATKKDGDRAKRRAIDRAHTAKASPRAKTLKLCDVTHNISCILEAPEDFARLYVSEKLQLLEVLREGHPVLFKRAQETLRWAQQMLGMESAVP